MHNRIRLTICGASYVISSDDSEAYLQSLAQRLQGDMNRVMDASPSIGMLSAAVITALNYLDEGEKNAAAADNMRQQIHSYLEDAAKAQEAAQQATQEVERLRSEVRRLREKLL